MARFYFHVANGQTTLDDLSLQLSALPIGAGHEQLHEQQS